MLDPGVDFVSASAGGAHDGATHTVTWTLSNVPSGESGTVSLTIEVNVQAVVMIANNASVRVGANAALPSNTVTNPVEPPAPEKTVSEDSETGQNSEPVAIGDQITYEISYVNYETVPATVVITDKLATGVDFVSASAGGAHDGATHTVTWTLPNVPSGESGTVSLTVEVNSQAVVVIANNASVRVGANAALPSNTVTNPMEPSNPDKTVSEDSETGQNSAPVAVGDQITYEISYGNYEAVPATVVITDVLDPGVDFVSASAGGAHDGATHTVTWTHKARCKSSVTSYVPTLAKLDKKVVGGNWSISEG